MIRVLCFIVLWCVPATAVAQAESETPSAAASFEAATVAFDAGDFEVALTHYRAAFDAAPHVDTRFNIAACLEELGRHREALLEFESAAAESPVGSDQRQEALERAATTRARLGEVQIVADSGEQGLPVSIGGEVMCTTPCRIALDPGEHRVSIASGNRHGESVVTVEQGGHGEVELMLSAPAPVELPTENPEITTDPIEAPDRSVGWFTWTSFALTAIAAGGTVGLGLHTESLGDEYAAMPSTELQDRGILMRTLTNVTLGVAIAAAITGVVALLIDLI